GHQVVALEGVGRVFGAVLGIELDALVHHDAGDAELQVGYDQARERQRALERLLAIDDEQLVRMVRMEVHAAQVAGYRLQVDVVAHRPEGEMNQCAGPEYRLSM